MSIQTEKTPVYRSLMEAAVAARNAAYAPYSGFRVGAALLTADGRMFTGCNVENSSFSATNCAERTAVFKAVSEGVQSFTAIAIVGGKGDALMPLCAPCGVCRQVLAEFASPDLAVILGTPADFSVHTLGTLLPFTFEL